MSEVVLQFSGVSKVFGEKQGNRSILKNISFSVMAGEFFSILGPSGCGKTTILRMISGLETPTEGQIFMDGQLVNHVHPHQRNVHMVFQKYALFPHLNVFENVAFGLRMKKMPSALVTKKVDGMLAMVKLAQYRDRPIHRLSGGEQQRVALIRALVNEPKILLLDEPLGALDQKLREEMQIELSNIQKQLKTTFIFVTHDQGEALTLSDRIAIMNKGKIEQIGTATEVYESPDTGFVAQFVGMSNLFKGTVSRDITSDSFFRVETGQFGALWVKRNAENAKFQGGDQCQVLVRPEKIRIRVTGPDNPQNLNVFRGSLQQRVYFGSTTEIKLQLNGGSLPPLVALVANQSSSKMPQLKMNERYYAVWDPSDSIILPLL